MPPLPEKFSRPADVAARYGIHERTVRNMIRRGVLPGVRIGKLYRIRLSEAAAVLEPNAHTPQR
jgi:excisionase family DNA binding protein